MLASMHVAIPVRVVSIVAPETEAEKKQIDSGGQTAEAPADKTSRTKRKRKTKRFGPLCPLSLI